MINKSITRESARQNVEDLRKALADAEAVEALEKEKEDREIQVVQQKTIITLDDDIPERYRSFIRPQRDKNNRQQWQHSILCIKELREAMLPQLDFMCEKTREWAARQSRYGFNATHVLTQACYNGLSDFRNWKFWTDEEICIRISEQ